MSTIGGALERSEADLRVAVNRFNEAQEYRAAQQTQGLLSQVANLYTHLRDQPGELLDTEL
jgi:hypothetical protein